MNFGVWISGCLLAAASATSAFAEEIRLYDNSRLYGLVQGVAPSGEIVVLQPTGDERRVALEDVISIRFLGRTPLLVQTGTQEFRFLGGGRIRGAIVQNEGDLLQVETAVAGPIPIDLAHLRGFVALPLAGFSGRKAEELVDGPAGSLSPSLDVVLDRRGSTYPGVVRKVDRTTLALDHEELLQVVPVRMLYVAGVRLANAARASVTPWSGDVQTRIVGRDGSEIQGTLNRIQLGKWFLSPAWAPQSELEIAVDEISLVQILGGRVQYLSQLEPVEVVESTILAPPQPYRMDRSCQGDALSIAGKRYPWGIGVHADSELTFALNKRFKKFRTEAGIASRLGSRGSVVFKVLGDGKVFYESGIVTGREQQPLEIDIAIEGVQQLTLSVTNAGDLDLGDVANWGSARVER